MSFLPEQLPKNFGLDESSLRLVETYVRLAEELPEHMEAAGFGKTDWIPEYIAEGRAVLSQCARYSRHAFNLEETHFLHSSTSQRRRKRMMYDLNSEKEELREMMRSFLDHPKHEVVLAFYHDRLSLTDKLTEQNHKLLEENAQLRNKKSTSRTWLMKTLARLFL